MVRLFFFPGISKKFDSLVSENITDNAKGILLDIYSKMINKQCNYTGHYLIQDRILHKNIIDEVIMVLNIKGYMTKYCECDTHYNIIVTTK